MIFLRLLIASIVLYESYFAKAFLLVKTGDALHNEKIGNDIETTNASIYIDSSTTMTSTAVKEEEEAGIHILDETTAQNILHLYRNEVIGAESKPNYITPSIRSKSARYAIRQIKLELEKLLVKPIWSSISQRIKPKRNIKDEENKNNKENNDGSDEQSDEEAEVYNSDEWDHELDVVASPHLLGPSATKYSPIPVEYQHYSTASTCHQILIQCKPIFTHLV